MCILPDDGQIYFLKRMTCLNEKLVKLLADDYRIVKEELQKYGQVERFSGLKIT